MINFFSKIKYKYKIPLNLCSLVFFAIMFPIYIFFGFVFRIFKIYFLNVFWVDAIGHLVGEPDFFLRENLHLKRKFSFVIILLPSKQVANKYYIKFLRENFYIIENDLLCRLLEPFLILGFNIIRTEKYFTNLNVTNPKKFEDNLNQFNIVDTLNNTYPKFTLELSVNEKKEFKELLKLFNLESYDGCVTLHFRDYKFRNANIGPRDTLDLSSYIKTIEYLTKQKNLAVIRMGRGDKIEVFPKKIDGFFDYASSKFTSDKNDVLLIGNSKFYIGTNSGLSVLCYKFKVPACFANYVPFCKSSWAPNSIYFPKLYKNKETRKFLTINELLNTPIINSIELEDYKNYEIIENSSDDILNFVKEFIDRIDGRYIESNEILEIRNKLKEKMSKRFSYKNNNISGYFLKKYEHLI